ncbi:hypothetical protein [Bacillus proteolyticus]|uniref:hypothetical protein n=1 Tax=Bacillus proteolyticus TaxID=2026192 RepID=UPI0030F3E150
MAYVIQNVKTKKYLKHNGDYNLDAYHFKDVNKPEEAEQYSSKEQNIFECGMLIDLKSLKSSKYKGAANKS